MPQVRKPEVDEQIREAALRCFAAAGYDATSMAAIAKEAGTAPANIYRYYPDGKRQLFETVVTDEVADEHERLITKRVETLMLPLGDRAVEAPAADRLLAFWIAHRFEVIILLGRADGTRFAGYGERFARLLFDLAVTRLRDAGAEPSRTARRLLGTIFDNTRRALVATLAAHEDAEGVQHAMEGFWSYQLPGLDGFYRWATANPGP